MRHNDEEMNHHSVGRMKVTVTKDKIHLFYEFLCAKSSVKIYFFQNDNFTIHIIWVRENVSTSQKQGDNLFFISYSDPSISKTPK